MKRIFVTMLALTLTAGVFAQSNNAKANKAKKEWRQNDKGDRKEKMKDLNLTESQRTQMKSLNEDFKNKMQSLKSDNSLSAEQVKQKRLELTKQHQSKIESLLTSDQKKIWKEKRDDMRDDRRDERGKGNRKPGQFGTRKDRHNRVGDITKNLNLSPEQQKNVATLNQKFKVSVDNIRTNTSLTQEQKKEQLKELHKDHKQSIESLLTSEQNKQLKETMKNDRRHRQDKTTR